MGKSGSAPSAPDPYQSAQAQYEYGTAGANYNMGLNAVNQNTPYGSTSWSQNPGGVPTTGSPNLSATTTGVHPSGSGVSGATGGAATPPPYAGAPGGLGAQAAAATPGGSSNPAALAAAMSAAGGGSGGVPNLTPPQYTETQSLSPAQQQLLNLQEGNTIGQGGLAGQVLSNNASSIASPLNLQTSVPGAGNQGQEYGDAFNTALTGNLAAISPQLNSQYEQLDAGLRNSGNLPGSPAYQTAMSQFTANEGGVLNQAAGAAENTGLNMENTLYGQNLSSAEFGNQAQLQQQAAPIQNYLALMGGVAPAGMSTPQQPSSSVSTPDIMSAFNNQYQGELNAYNANVGSENQTTGDLATVASLAAIVY